MNRHGTALILAMWVQMAFIHAADWPQFRGPNRDGNMGLLEANPAAFNMLSMFQLPKGEGPCWTHPVISNGKLHLRWSENLYVYDIKERPR